MTVTFPPEGYYTGDPLLSVTGTVSPTVGVTITVNLNGTQTYTPTLGVTGAFTQPVTLTQGANVLTIAANDGIHTTQVVRHVQYGAAHDNNILWDQLGHNSRDARYRTPNGPVTAGTAVTLRLRSASGDLTEARVRVWDDRLNVQTMLSMHLAANDGTYEWWEVDLPVSPDPTIYWYRFFAIDGTTTVYYEDDAARTGGWGQAFSASPDYGWQLTMYAADFHTPDWVKNAIVYQIYPDRFRDGDLTNDTPAGTFFYNEAGGTIYRSNQTDWNTVICDPRQTGTACTGSYSKNFYGGDLQGLKDKLSYIHDLGVTTIYLNPIFESPSNHKYDATNYGVIDDNFGNLVLFEQLVSEANAAGDQSHPGWRF